MVIMQPLGGIAPELGIKLIVLLGFSNLLLLLMTWLSCRCRRGLIKNMKPGSFYEKFFNNHCIFWKLFVISVAIHFVIAMMTFGIPF